jgi:ribosomal protein S27E
MESTHESKSLVRCAICSSDLIYPLRCVGHGRRCVVDRRCPECEHHDRVITSRLAAELWCRRNSDIAEELDALADALACGLALDVPDGFR